MLRDRTCDVEEHAEAPGALLHRLDFEGELAAPVRPPTDPSNLTQSLTRTLTLTLTLTQP